MTHAKKLKRAIRARAAKTGESYTSARLHVLASRRAPATDKPATTPTILGDDRVVKATGHGFNHWFKVLDAFDARAKGHTASAAHLRNDHGVRGWHAQMITVEYERARGLRSKNQSCAGDFQVGVSRAVNGSIEDVVAVLSGTAWIGDVDPDLALAFPKPAKFVVKAPKTAKLRYKWGPSPVEIRITARKGGSTVVADTIKLADAAQVERRRAQWKQALELLRALLKK